MKVGDLVQYVEEGVEEDTGVIVAIHRQRKRPDPVTGSEIVSLVDVLWDNGIWTAIANEFKVIS